MNNGYIKLSRKMLDWEWISTTETAHLFIVLLLMANWEDKKFQGHEVKRGQLITSINSLCELTGLSPRQIRTSLSRLQKTGEISVETTNRWSLITVENYGLYQDAGQDCDKQATNERQTSDKQATTTKEYKNKRNKEYIYMRTSANPNFNKDTLFEEFWKVYPKKKGKESAKKAFAKISLTESLFEEILNAVKAQKDSRDWQKEDGQFIPYPATWLNGRRWEDEATQITDDSLERWLNGEL